MGRRARLAGSVLAAFVVCGLVSSCQDATQIVVEARTNLVYRGGLVVAFTVGSPGETEHADPTTEWRDGWAADGVIGSLAVVPGSGKDGALGVKLVMGVDRDARSCTPPEYRGCIVARRLLHYTPHSRLRLPVTLYAQCKNVLCNEASTCNVLGQCVPAQVDQGTCGGAEGCVAGSGGSPDDSSSEISRIAG